MIFKNLFLIIIAVLIVILFSPVAVLYRVIKDNTVASQYLFNIALGVDQLGGTILYNEKLWSVSSWTYHISTTAKRYYYFMLTINFLFGKDHCHKSWVWECEVNQQNLKEGEL